ncbi:MAG: hypothetical protein COW30_11475 [Rhodospirillales bacterium CG15_BIG_FIL_POST_REV_8_21_14_020_66_15]|nr:MAG: hypothetical protein COW30_11475 [Rhodospirillales bacterium CG15_BIG_FIL_POST_REV_8_21_14_020_66_15]
MEMHDILRDINRTTIHELVPNLSVAELKPYFMLVAKARGTYIKRLVDLAHGLDHLPSDEQVRELSLLRRSYDELIHGAQMIETAIERGYIDVEAEK